MPHAWTIFVYEWNVPPAWLVCCTWIPVYTQTFIAITMPPKFQATAGGIQRNNKWHFLAKGDAMVPWNRGESWLWRLYHLDFTRSTSLQSSEAFWATWWNHNHLTPEPTRPYYNWKYKVVLFMARQHHANLCLLSLGAYGSKPQSLKSQLALP